MNYISFINNKLLFYNDAIQSSGGGSSGSMASFVTDALGTTWGFNTSVQVGQYVTQDYWHVGNVSITGVTKPHATLGKDGSAINPGAGVNGFDAGIAGYTNGNDVSRSFPFTHATGTSLVSTVSWDAADPGVFLDNGNPRPRIRRASVLTAEVSAPAANAFRPHWSSGTKLRFTTSDITYANLPSGALPSYPRVTGTVPTLTEVEDYIRHMWLENHDISDGDLEQFWSPSENQTNYGRDQGVRIGLAAIYLCSNKSQVGDTTTLSNLMIQLGIDLYGQLLAGCHWVEQGALGYWKKFPILYAGTLLNHSGMMNIGNDYPSTGRYFAEDASTFYVGSGDIARVLNIQSKITVSSATSTLASGISQRPVGSDPEFADRIYGYATLSNNIMFIASGTGAGQYRKISSSSQVRGTDIFNTSGIYLIPDIAWSPAPNNTSIISILGYQNSTPGGYTNVAVSGQAEWGVYHTHQSSYDNPTLDADYRPIWACGGSMIILAANMLGLKTIWRHDALFDYMKRHMIAYSGDVDNRDCDPYGVFAGNTWDTYISLF